MEWIRKQLGVSLIELLVALAILAIALVPLLSLFLHALKMTEHSNKRTLAINLVRDIQEEIRSREFAEPYEDALGGPSVVGFEETPFVPGTDSRLTKLDDVDDYNSWCRGQDCQCGGTEPDTGVSTDGLCDDNSPLEAYDGTTYDGRGYPLYLGFTRMVEVYNIWPNVSTTSGREAPEHWIALGAGSYRKDEPFNFFDLREENFPNLTSCAAKGSAKGNSRLKVVKVTVTYTGAVTPDVKIEDTALVVLPVSREGE
jgi:prepilin-type N-terminal cleavage/methylation domain-containing protein